MIWLLWLVALLLILNLLRNMAKCSADEYRAYNAMLQDALVQRDIEINDLKMKIRRFEVLGEEQYE